MNTLTSVVEPRRRCSFFRQLWLWVLVAMVVGAVLGAVEPDLGARMAPFGDAFIKLIAMVIGPLIFCTIVNGMAHMADMKRVGRVAIKAIVVFEVMTLLAEIVGLLAVNILHPGTGMNIDIGSLNGHDVESYIAKSAQIAFVPFLMGIIPNSFVGAFVQGNILQVLFIAVLCGFALIRIGPKGQPFIDVLEVAMKMIFGIVGFIMWVAPIGAYGAIAFTVGKFGVASLTSLGKLIGDFYVTCLVFILITSIPVARLCGFSVLKFIRYFWNEILVSIATTSAEVVLPRVMAKLKHLGCDESIVGLVVPAGYSFNLTGACLYLGMSAVFLAQATNTPLDVMHQIVLLLVMNITSKGAAGIAGAAFVVLVATISMDGSIPVASAVLILGIHRLMSQGFTPTFVITNTMATIAITKWEGGLDEKRMVRVLESRDFGANEEVCS